VKAVRERRAPLLEIGWRRGERVAGLVGLASLVATLLAGAVRCGINESSGATCVVDLVLTRGAMVLLPAMLLWQAPLRLLVYAVSNGLLATLFQVLQREAAQRAGAVEQRMFVVVCDAIENVVNYTRM
jgi:hypothetical protein